MFDAGAVQAKATLDASPFQTTLTKLKADVRRFQGESATITLKADTRDADAKLDETSAKANKLSALTATPKVRFQTVEAMREINAVKDHLDDLGKQVATAKIQLAGDEKATRKLEDFEFKMRRLDHSVARPNIDLRGIQSAKIAADQLETQLGRIGSGGGSGRGGGSGGWASAFNRAGRHAPGTLKLLGAGLLPTVAPATGLALGAGAGLLTPLVAGGLGLGGFGLGAKSTVAGLEATIKQLTALQTKYKTASDSKTRDRALEQEQALWKSLSPAQQQAIKNVKELDLDWSHFQKTLRSEVFPAVAKGVALANTGLKYLLPSAKATGKEIDSLESSAEKAFKAPFWHQFFDQFLPGQATKATGAFATTLGNLATGGAHLVEDFAPLGGDFERDLVRLSQRFESWTEGSGPSKFVGWVEKNGPKITRDLEQLASGGGSLVKSLLPLGTSELAIMGDTAKWIGDLAGDDPTAIKDIGEALVAVAIGLKAIKAAGAITSTVQDLSALSRLGKGGALSKLLSAGGSGICGCGPARGGPTIIGRGKATAETAEGEEVAAGEGAAGVGLLSRFAGKGGPVALGAFADYELGKQALKGHGNSSATRTGLTTAGLAGAGAGVGSVLFPGVGTAVGAGLGAGAGLFLNHYKSFGGLNVAGLSNQVLMAHPTAYLHSLGSNVTTQQALPLVQQALKTNNSQGLAALAQMAKTIPAVNAALQQLAATSPKAQKVLASLSQTTSHTANASLDLANAEVQMGYVASKVGGRITGNTMAAQANRAAFENAGKKVLAYRDSLINAGVPTDQIASKTRKYAASLIDQAKNTYNSATEVDRLAKKLGLLPSQITTKVIVNAEQADSGVQKVKHWLDELHNKSISLTVRERISQTTPGDHASAANPLFPATGGYITGPGTATSDSIPAWLSNGEYVLRASAVKHFGTDLLHSMNRYASGGLIHNYSTGGAVKMPSVPAKSNAIASVTNFAGLTFVNDLKGTEKQIRSGITQMIDRLNDDIRKHYLTSDKRTVAALKTARTSLINLVDAETSVSKKLATAQTTLANLRSDASSLKTSTLSSFQSLGDLSQLTTTPSNVGQVVSILGQQDQVGSSFKANLDKLKAMGLSKTQYDELEQAGPAQAGSIVALLTQATPSQIKAINSSTSLLTSLGKSAASSGADYVYGTKIKDAQGTVASDKKQLKRLEDLQKRTAEASEKLVKDGIKDDGTHALLKDVRSILARSEKYLAALSTSRSTSHRTTPVKR